jgi:P pilus assembly chaperone PapD
MKKLMVMAAMLALMLAASAPAFASTAIGGDVEFVDSDQAQLSLTIQRNSGNDQDLAGVAQSLSVDQNQVLAADDSTAAGGDVFFD